MIQKPDFGAPPLVAPEVRVGVAGTYSLHLGDDLKIFKNQLGVIFFQIDAFLG